MRKRCCLEFAKYSHSSQIVTCEWDKGGSAVASCALYFRSVASWCSRYNILKPERQYLGRGGGCGPTRRAGELRRRATRDAPRPPRSPLAAAHHELLVRSSEFGLRSSRAARARGHLWRAWARENTLWVRKYNWTSQPTDTQAHLPLYVYKVALSIVHHRTRKNKTGEGISVRRVWACGLRRAVLL